MDWWSERHAWLLTYVQLMLQLSSWAKRRAGWLPSSLVCLNICTRCTWDRLTRMNGWDITGPGQQPDQMSAISQHLRRLLCWALKDLSGYMKLVYVSHILGATTPSSSLLTTDWLCSLQRPGGTQCPLFLSAHSHRNLSQQNHADFHI